MGHARSIPVPVQAQGFPKPVDEGGVSYKRPENALAGRGKFLGFVLMGSLLLGGGIGMTAVSNWLAGDWRKVQDCEATYWTCDAVVAGAPRTGGNELVGFSRLARSCHEYAAWETAVRRASFDCSMGRDVVGSTCKLQEADCRLPTQHY